jgi:hypothetical protein
MKKALTLILATLAFLQLSAQDKEGIHEGMVRFQGTFAIGFDQNKQYGAEQRYYLYGEGEYLLGDHLGLNGATFFNLGSSSNLELINGKSIEDTYVHSVLAGPVHHFFDDQPLDLFVGLQPGFSVIDQYNYNVFSGNARAVHLAPTASVFGGLAWYGSFFHLFAQARYVNTLVNTQQFGKSLNDLRLSIGLGFNFN